MARNRSKKGTGIFTRIIMGLLGVLLVLFGLYRLSIVVMGRTTTAQVTGVTVRHDHDSDEGDETDVTTSYAFTVDGVTYTGHETETLKDRNNQRYNEEFVTTRQNRQTVSVRYLIFRPGWNMLDKGMASGLGTTLLVLALGGFMLFFAFSRDKKKETVQENVPLSSLSTKYVTYIDSPEESAETAETAKICPDCGAEITPGGRFCPGCAKNVE